MNQRSFRLGTTSYIIADNLVNNARFLAGQVDDMELVLFDLADGRSNLPSPKETAELKAIGQIAGLSYTVHLPLDIRLTDDGSLNHPSILLAEKVITCTRPLNPLAYVFHLDGRHIRHLPQEDTARWLWQEHIMQALSWLADQAGGWSKLALENVEGYALDFLDPFLQATAVRRCIDIGHLWVDNHHLTVPQYLEHHLPRTSVIHLHGLDADGHDHHSLDRMSEEALLKIIQLLQIHNFAGVLTMEIFERPDFEASLARLAPIFSRLYTQ
ncbi:MAG: cobamide remodeling phosphodiesterase CbiR [Ardenticatenaceae bacterium]|nr:cobamide remodeling phosphodiesterase CbiR [Ardenticatenaceae bacterium]